MPKARPKVAIVGVGLIGGSLGMAWKAAAAVSEVIGVARRPETIEEAVRAGAVDWGTLDLAEGVREADVVILPSGRGDRPPLSRA